MKKIVISVIIGVLVGIILQFLTPLNLLNLFSIVFSKIWSLLNFKLLIPIWLIIIIGIIVFFVIKFVSIFITSSIEEPQKPEWYFYRMDEFDDKLFTWEYGYDYYNKIATIENLHQICKKCHCELSFNGFSSIYYCPNCRAKYQEVASHRLSDIGKLIQHKIKQGEYKESPYFKI